MLTRCPHCETTFRVGPDQLKVRQGKVRCGECQEVFNALEALTDELPALQIALPRMQEVMPPEPAAPAEVEPQTLPEPAAPVEAETEPPAPEPPAPELPPAVDVAPAEPPPVTWAQDEPLAEPRRWPWIVGALTLLVLAFAQLLFIYRIELTVQMPEIRPALVAACATLGCDVPYPHRVDLVGIEASDLVPEGRDRLLLSATLKNRATFIQEHPHLELTLTDNHDEPIVRKVLAPADYLPAGKTPGGGFAARGETFVKLLLDVKDVPAVGYRLYLFYP